MKITLNDIKSKSPCQNSFKILLKYYDKVKADDTIVTVNHLLKTLDVPDTLWVIDRLCEDKRKMQLMSAEFAKRVLYIWEDWAKDNAKEHLNSPRKIIELIEANASREEIDAAWAADGDAAGAAAWDAAWDAAWAAAWAADGDAARDAAGAAARAAAWAAAGAAAGDAAWDAERQKQAEIILKYYGEK